MGIEAFWKKFTKEEPKTKRAIRKRRKTKKALLREKAEAEAREKRNRRLLEIEERKKTEREWEGAASGLESLYPSEFSSDLIQKYVFVEGVAFSSILYGDTVLFDKGELEALKENAILGYRFYRAYPDDAYGFWEVSYLSRYLTLEAVRGFEIKHIGSHSIVWRQRGVDSYVVPPRVSDRTKKRLLGIAEKSRRAGEISESTYQGVRIGIGFHNLSSKLLKGFSEYYSERGANIGVAPIMKKYVEYLLMLTTTTSDISFDEGLDGIPLSDTVLFAKSINYDFAFWKMYKRFFSGSGQIESFNKEAKDLLLAYEEKTLLSEKSFKLWGVNLKGTGRDDTGIEGVCFPTTGGKRLEIGNPRIKNRELFEVPLGRTLLDIAPPPDDDDGDASLEIGRLVSMSSVSLAKYFMKVKISEVARKRKEVEGLAADLQIAKIATEAERAIEGLLGEFEERLRDEGLERIKSYLTVVEGAPVSSAEEVLVESIDILHQVAIENAAQLPVAGVAVYEDAIEKRLSGIMSTIVTEIVDEITDRFSRGLLLIKSDTGKASGTEPSSKKRTEAEREPAGTLGEKRDGKEENEDIPLNERALSRDQGEVGKKKGLLGARGLDLGSADDQNEEGGDYEYIE